jgi:hypothetical protein
MHCLMQYRDKARDNAEEMLCQWCLAGLQRQSQQQKGFAWVKILEYHIHASPKPCQTHN